MPPARGMVGAAECKHIGAERGTDYTFRHTCASRLVQKGVDILRVLSRMGHMTVQTPLRTAPLAPQHLDDVLKVLEGGGGSR